MTGEQTIAGEYKEQAAHSAQVHRGRNARC